MIDRQTMLCNIKKVREQIADAAEKSGRKFEDIKLVGAVKTMPSDLIAEAMPYLYAAGENRVNEFERNLGNHAYGSGKIHFIGHLQTNKVKKVAGKVSLIQSVDSLKLAACISDYMIANGGVQQVLLEVNIGQEPSKSGVFPDQAHEFAEQCGRLPGIKVAGLMAIPPVCGENHDNSGCFSQLNQLFIDISEKKYDNVNMCILSMGMSSDYYQAVLNGANMVRIGSAIFGKREPIITA